MHQSPLFEQITIIGLGLIGSSIARAAHKQNLVQTIVGSDHNEVSLAYARKHGFINMAQSNLPLSVKGSALVILATPPSSLASITQDIAPHLQADAIVMDVCSVKQSAMAAIAPHVPAGVYYIPAHPIAGSEQSGVSAGRADLFEHKRIVLTPDDLGHSECLQTVMSFWRGMGARIEAMPAHLHDMIYAHVSHLPQLLAFTAARLLEPYELPAAPNEKLQPFLRLSRSSTDLWADIFLMNRENILKALDSYLDAVTHIIREFKDAPPGHKTENDETLSRFTLFPRIAAACLVTTVMLVEKQAGFSFARYAGTGFADFTSPASHVPDSDIENISHHYPAVASILGDYRDRLKQLRTAINTGSADDIKQAL